METFFDRMKLLIDEFGDGRPHTFGRKAMIPKGTMARYIKDRIPKPEHLVRIHETFDVNLNWLFTGIGERFIIKDGEVDKKTNELIAVARRVLKSNTHYAESLAANIKSFSRGLDSEQNIKHCEPATGADLKSIRADDPIEKKAELLKLRTM